MVEQAIRSFSISDREFKNLSSLIYDLFGIVLTDKKKTLVIGRLQSELKKKKPFESLEQEAMLNLLRTSD